MAVSFSRQGGQTSREADASSSQPPGILAANGARKRKEAQPTATLLTEFTEDQIKGMLKGMKQADRDKWSRCVHDVMGKGSNVDPYAVCTTSVGVPDKEGGPGSGVPHGKKGASSGSGKTTKPKGHASTAPKTAKTAKPPKAGKHHAAGPAKPTKPQKNPLIPKTMKQSGDGPMNLKSRLIEKSSDNDGESRYLVTLIQEGLGNFKDAFYYTKEALESAKEIFEAKKSYCNHPSKSQEIDQPERSVRDIAGHFESCEIVEVDGRAELQAQFVVPAGRPYDWARATADHALTYKEKYQDDDKNFVGLSINASGDAEEVPIEKVMESAPDPCKAKLQEAIDRGIESVNMVSQIQDAVSVDLVTEAGAGGKILKLLEERKNMAKKSTKQGRVTREAAPGAGDGDDGGADGDEDHDDADQDKALIAQMIKKHLGDKADDMDESEQSEVYETAGMYQAEGMEEEEAMKCAAMHQAIEKKKKEKKEAADAMEGKGGGDQPSPDSLHAEGGGGDGGGKPALSPTEKHEAAAIKLAGRVAFLEKELKSEKLERYVSKKLETCGLPRKATKLFTEKAGSFRDEKDFDSKFKLFTEAYGLERDEAFTYVPSIEKTIRGSENEDDQTFSDCVKE